MRLEFAKRNLRETGRTIGVLVFEVEIFLPWISLLEAEEGGELSKCYSHNHETDDRGSAWDTVWRRLEPSTFTPHLDSSKENSIGGSRRWERSVNYRYVGTQVWEIWANHFLGRFLSGSLFLGGLSHPSSLRREKLVSYSSVSTGCVVLFPIQVLLPLPFL